MQDLKIVTRFFSETPRLVVIGNSCLKLFSAAVRRELIASTQLLDSPITSPRQRNSLKSWSSFERVFFDMYSGTIQIVAFTFTLSASKYIFFLSQSEFTTKTKYRISSNTFPRQTARPFSICCWLLIPDQRIKCLNLSYIHF